MRIWVVFIFLLFWLIGCYTPKMARRDLAKVDSHFPALAADWCNEKYIQPGGRDTVTQIEIIEIICPDTSDAVPQPMPTPEIPQDKPKKVIRLQPGTVTKIEYKTITIRDTIVNTAPVAACEERAKLTQSVLSKSVNRERKWKNIYLGSSIALLIIGLIMGWLLKRK